MMKKIMTSYRQQRGVVLVISLIMLLVMTLIGITGMQTTILEEKMAGNYRNKNIAFQAAESGLLEAETFLKITAILPSFSGTAGYYLPTASGLPRWDDSVLSWSTPAAVIAYTGPLSNFADPPDYIIEEMPATTEDGSSLEAGVALENRYYRVTTRAVGGTNTAVVMLQSTYKR